MSRVQPRPELPEGALFENLTEGLYRWRMPEEPWLYCVGQKNYRVLCQKQQENLIIYKLNMREMFHLNRILSRVHFRGRLRYSKEGSFLTERGPYPDTEYFPGMIITPEARIVNGAWFERDKRREFRGQLRVYLSMLKGYLKWRSQYPLPDEEKDCIYCRRVRRCRYDTMYDRRNHNAKHLREYEMNGTLLWQALHEAGYGTTGKLQVLGYIDEARPLELSNAVENYFRKRGGF